MKALRKPRVILALCAALIGLQIIVLYFLGQPTICTCGYVKLWESVVLSIGNSQHLTDWFTFSHVLHGFAFYALAHYFFPRQPLLVRLLMAVSIEVAWEILENTPWVINHYREQPLAEFYSGDSILNSVSDTLAAVVGFVLAWRLPTYMTITLFIVFEAFVGYQIRDNLTLNIVNLLFPFDFILNWQQNSPHP